MQRYKYEPVYTDSVQSKEKEQKACYRRYYANTWWKEIRK
jgi:hypothetical protein